MTTVTAVATRVRIAAAASAIVAAATLAPAAVAYAAETPGIGGGLATATVTECPPLEDCAVPDVSTLFAPGGSSSTAIGQSPLFWLGSPANPNFQPLFGVAFPSFGLDFEACFLGAAVHLSPYGTGFVGLGLGC